ncbi:hypothetical protein SS50377_26693 [Spironucleus salmonicida]|uniref:Uncharacterized protein n=1 Tax=Spironucleus salmonicida TaxID=348837 RepID=V6LX29_9EUKA|nr:hypothetical protein SS50377_26693 [Spironucleus salmonicida]|eukprot:EST49167.1 hypothetical protein SS50377_10380 [Spironucleus salmonicida]
MFGALIPQRLVDTNFSQISPNILQLVVSEFHLVKFITVFAINPPPLQDNCGYSVYVQPQNKKQYYLGQITKTAFSISKAVNFLQNDQEATCRIYIVMEDLKNSELPEDESMKLLQVGVALVNDFEKFISSFDDIYHEGNHYVDSQCVGCWIQSVESRVKLNQRFWDGVE